MWRLRLRKQIFLSTGLQTRVSQLPGMSRSSVPQTTQEERGGKEGRERREEVGAQLSVSSLSIFQGSL